MGFENIIKKSKMGITIGSIVLSLGLIACGQTTKDYKQISSVTVGEVADKQAVDVKFKGTVTPNRFKSIVWGFTAHLENYNNAPFKYKAESAPSKHLDSFHYTITRLGNETPDYRIMTALSDENGNERVVIFSEKEHLDRKVLETYARLLE